METTTRQLTALEHLYLRSAYTKSSIRRDEQSHEILDALVSYGFLAPPEVIWIRGGTYENPEVTFVEHVITLKGKQVARGW